MVCRRGRAHNCPSAAHCCSHLLFGYRTYGVLLLLLEELLLLAVLLLQLRNNWLELLL
jgi:hypothetical protein